MLLALAWRISWAVASSAYTMIACTCAGHPHAYWRDGIRRCACGLRA